MRLLKTRSLVCVLFSLLIIADIAIGQESSMIQFSDGKIASADDVNDNFENLDLRLQAIEQGGGCSVVQKDSAIVVSCADGSSGVLAGAGTVVVYPQGAAAKVDLTTLRTGDLIVVDANDVVLAVLREGSENSYLVELPSEPYGYVLAWLRNNSDDQSVVLDCYPNCPGLRIFFESEDCVGQAFVSNPSYLYKAPDGTWLAPSEQTTSIPQVTLSSFSGGVCSNVEIADSSRYIIFPYTPPLEITNAVYPIRATQLE